MALGGGAVVHSQLENDSHADTVVAGSNCIITQFTGKECDVLPHAEACEVIKSVPFVQAAMACDNPKTTGETTILQLNKEIWIGNKIDHTLVNPNQL